MKPQIAASAFVFAAITAAALAQPTSPASDAWRFKLQKVDGGFLRLDAQTGQVSFCRERDASWTCETAADDRAALEAEIKRLSERVAELEQKRNNPSERFRAPSDQELEQVMGFFEKVMKRFRGVVENLKKEWETDSPNRS